jgi:hypothetical protein
MTAAWTADEPARSGAAEELDVAPRRPDGTLRLLPADHEERA